MTQDEDVFLRTGEGAVGYIAWTGCGGVAEKPDGADITGTSETSSGLDIGGFGG